MRLTGLAGIAAMSVGVTWTGVARADDTKIALRISGCEAANIRADRLFELMRTELFPRQLVAGDIGPGAPELSADVRLCMGTVNTASIVIQRAGLGVAERGVDLSDVVGDLRARTLAVALAEMVTSLPVEQRNSSTSSSNSPGAILDSTTPAIVASKPADLRGPAASAPSSGTRGSEPGREQSSRSLKLGAGIALRHFFGPSTSLIGPWMSAFAHRFSGEALFLTSNNSAPVGSVTLYNLDVAAAYEIIAWGESPKLGLRLRGELGKTWAKGNPTDPSSARGQTDSSTQAAALLEVLVESPMSRRFGIEAHLSAGAARGLIATADYRASATTNGLFVGAGLGLSFDLGEI